jgi:hypothetical protein
MLSIPSATATQGGNAKENLFAGALKGDKVSPASDTFPQEPL